MMRVIIAGGREHRDERLVVEAIAAARAEGILISEPATGGAPGIDTLAYDYLWRWLGTAPKIFRADWKMHGRAAGPIRNEAMAVWASEFGRGALIAIPGKGRGTFDMIERAEKHGLRVYVHRCDREIQSNDEEKPGYS